VVIQVRLIVRWSSQTCQFEHRFLNTIFGSVAPLGSEQFQRGRVLVEHVREPLRTDPVCHASRLDSLPRITSTQCRRSQSLFSRRLIFPTNFRWILTGMRLLQGIGRLVRDIFSVNQTLSDGFPTTCFHSALSLLCLAKFSHFEFLRRPDGKT